MNKVYYTMFGYLVAAALVCYVVLQVAFPAVATSNAFIVSGVKIHHGNTCDYEISQRSSKSITNYFTIRDTCGHYFAGDNVVVTKCYPDPVRIKR